MMEIYSYIKKIKNMFLKNIKRDESAYNNLQTFHVFFIHKEINPAIHDYADIIFFYKSFYI